MDVFGADDVEGVVRVDQLRHFFEATFEDRLFPLWRLTAMTGMRRGEVLGLRWEDVDFRALTVTVNRQRSRGEGGVVVSPPKTDRGRRSIDIDRETVSVLKEWRRVQLEERMAFEGGWLETGLIFTKKNGAAFDPDVASQRFDRMAKDAELPRIRFHDLRHTHATLLLLAGVSLCRRITARGVDAPWTSKRRVYVAAIRPCPASAASGRGESPSGHGAG